jgi:MYXO-CTERM domain-containing protein
MKQALKLLATVCTAMCATAPLHAETIYGMTAVNSSGLSAGVGLVRFDSATPGTVTTIGSFSGVVAGQALRSIDFRPADGQLYALSSGTTAGTAALAQLYTVNLATAALTKVGAAGFSLTGNTATRIEMDFNPVADRVRIIVGGTTNRSYRADPNTGALVATDTSIDYAVGDPLAGTGPIVLAAAYSNNVAGAASTTLYAWDFNTDALTTVGGLNGVPSPNGGQMFTVATPPGGALLVNQSGIGMDISGASGVLYVTHDDPATGSFMSLFTRNLSTGAQSLVGNYPTGLFVADISVAVVPEPATWAMAALGLAGLLARRRPYLRA